MRSGGPGHDKLSNTWSSEQEADPNAQAEDRRPASFPAVRAPHKTNHKISLEVVCLQREIGQRQRLCVHRRRGCLNAQQTQEYTTRVAQCVGLLQLDMLHEMMAHAKAQLQAQRTDGWKQWCSAHWYTGTSSVYRCVKQPGFSGAAQQLHHGKVAGPASLTV